MIYLIKCRHWCDENDCICVVEIRDPSMPLTAGTTNIVKMPRYSFSVEIQFETVGSYTHGLEACTKDIV